MKRLIASLACLSAVGLGAGLTAGSTPPLTTAAEGQEQYAVDGSHSVVWFRIKHLGVSWAYGRFNDVKGSFSIHEDYPEASSVEVTVQAASVDTNDKGRDEHLRSPDFLSAKEFPTLRFESTSVSKEGDRWTVEGQLSFHGVTRTITMDAVHVGSGPDPWGGQRAGFEGTFQVNAKDYELDWILENEGALGAEISVTVSLEGILQR